MLLSASWIALTSMKGTHPKLRAILNFLKWSTKLLFSLIILAGLLFIYLRHGEKLISLEQITLIPQGGRYYTQCPFLEANSSMNYLHSVQPEEIDFPLAFSLVVYTDSERVLRLLRAIYRPHNYYCIHIDRKSPPAFVAEIERLKQCKEMNHNVYFVERSSRLNVHWGRLSVLDADLICARILLERAPTRWKYWINLTGQEFPLRTNWELVRALSLLNGTNLVDAIYRRRIMHRCPPKGEFPFNVSDNLSTWIYHFLRDGSYTLQLLWR